MKKLMITAAASALIMGAAACSNENDVAMNDNGYDEAEMETADTETAPEMTDEAEAPDVETVYLMSGDLSAGELIGAKVIGADGEDAATIDDFIINSDGQIDRVVFRSGDFIDLLGTQGALAFDQLDLEMAADNEPRFTVSMTEEALQNVEEYDQDGLNDYSLASEIIGTTADFTNSDESARINDIIISADGEAKYAIVGDTIMDNDRQLDFDRIIVDEDGDALMIDAAADDLAMMPIFIYEMEDDASAADSERNSMSDWDADEADTDASDEMMDDDQN